MEIISNKREIKNNIIFLKKIKEEKKILQSLNLQLPKDIIIIIQDYLTNENIINDKIFKQQKILKNYLVNFIQIMSLIDNKFLLLKLKKVSSCRGCRKINTYSEYCIYCDYENWCS